MGINNFKQFEEKLNKLLGIECILEIQINNKSNEAYLPKDWTMQYFHDTMKEFLIEIKQHYGAKQLLKVDILTATDFLNTAKPKEKAIEIVKTLRDSYIKEYLNN